MDTSNSQQAGEGRLEYVRVGKVVCFDHALCIEGKPEFGIGNLWITPEETEKIASGGNVRLYKFTTDGDDVRLVRAGTAHLSKSGKAFLLGYCLDIEFRLLSVPTAQLTAVLEGRRKAALLSEMQFVQEPAQQVLAAAVGVA